MCLRKNVFGRDLFLIFCIFVASIQTQDFTKVPATNHSSYTISSCPLQPKKSSKIDVHGYQSITIFCGELISATILKSVTMVQHIFCPNFSHFFSCFTVFLTISFALLPWTPHRLYMRENTHILMSISYRTLTLIPTGGGGFRPTN